MNEYKDDNGNENFVSDSYTPYDLEERLVNNRVYFKISKRQNIRLLY